MLDIGATTLTALGPPNAPARAIVIGNRFATPSPIAT